MKARFVVVFCVLLFGVLAASHTHIAIAAKQVEVPFGSSIADSALDGVLGAEWNDAKSFSTRTGRYTANIYIKHDGEFLYIAVTKQGRIAGGNITLWMVFDANRDGRKYTRGDDSLMLPETAGNLSRDIDYAYTSTNQLPKKDTSIGGTNDKIGAGKFSNNTYVYETKIKMASGDGAGNDIALRPCSTIPWWVGFANSRGDIDVESGQISIHIGLPPSPLCQLQTDKPVYCVGERIVVSYTNTGNTLISCTTYPITISKNGQPVFDPDIPFPMLLYTGVNPGESWQGVWDQKDLNDNQVPPGSYTVIDSTCDCRATTTFQIVACEEEEKVLDHAMCKGVENNQCVSRTTTFRITDERAYNWVRMKDVRVGDSYKWEFYGPNGSLHTTITGTSEGPGYRNFWAYIVIAGWPPANMPGQWTVDFYYEGVYQYTDHFKIQAPSVLPDLTWSNLLLIPSSPKLGGSITFQGTFKNDGAQSIGEFDINLEMIRESGTPLAGAWFPVEGMAPGEERTVTYQWPHTFIIPGKHQVTLTSDYHNEITESNERNNVIKRAFEVMRTGTLPDLTLSSIDIMFSPSPVIGGRRTTITATIHNIGSTDAHNVKVLFLLDGQSLSPALEPIAFIPAGQAMSIFVYWSGVGRPQPGDHVITVRIDPNNTIAELNESNNDASKNVTAIRPEGPDLVWVGIDYSPRNPVSGDRLRISGDYMNQGNEPVPAGYEIKWEILKDDITVAGGSWEEASPLNPGEIMGFDIGTGYTLRPGTYVVVLLLDPYDAIAEPNEHDNRMAVRFEVKA